MDCFGATGLVMDFYVYGWDTWGFGPIRRDILHV